MNDAPHGEHAPHAFVGALKILGIAGALICLAVAAAALLLPEDIGTRVSRALSPAYTPTDAPDGLHLAALNNDIDEIKRLVSAGADPNEQVDWVIGVPRTGSPLHAAAAAGNADAIRALVELGGSVRRRTGHGAPIVSVAADEVVPLLVQLGADVNQGDQFGMPPVFRAAMIWHYDGDRSRFDMLVELGADLEKRDERERTVLGYLEGFPGTGPTRTAIEGVIRARQ